MFYEVILDYYIVFKSKQTSIILIVVILQEISVETKIKSSQSYQSQHKIKLNFRIERKKFQVSIITHKIKCISHHNQSHKEVQCTHNYLYHCIKKQPTVSNQQT